MENYGRIRENLKDMIYHELEAISDGGQMTFECVQVIGELVDVLKDLCEVEEADAMSGEGGYSQRGRSMTGYGNSYYGNRGRSYGNGYSRDDAKKDTVMKLENLLGEVRDEHDRQSIQRMIDQMR